MTLACTPHATRTDGLACRSTPVAVIACPEPLSIGLHAVDRAGELLGRTVLVTCAGAGMIGYRTCTTTSRPSRPVGSART